MAWESTFSDSCGGPELQEILGERRSEKKGEQVGTAKMIFFVGLTLLMSSRAALKPA